MARILVVDDEVRMATLIQRELADRGHTVEIAGDGQAALDRCSRDPFDLVITDLKMPGMDGLELLRRLREGADCPEVVLMTAYASAQTAVEAMKEGAWDYLIKPFEMDELTIMVDRITERDQLKAENEVLREQVHGTDATIIGDSEAMHHVLDLVGKVADQETTVLIEGESGTGKELIARAIHAASPRTSGPFVAVNCGAIPETLLESELFGHEKGAFTGADARRKGRFEVAAGGTLFLDEVGELSLQAQVKLLRVLQERVIERVGGGGEVPVDVRVLAATNQDLARMVAEGRFREDLYYRLNVFPIHIPPLRDRREDIPDLARHLAAGLDRPARLSEAAYPVLAEYEWPGNVRELENIIERAAILAGPGSPIGPDHLTGLTGTPTHRGGGGPEDPVRIPEAGVDLEELEKRHILEALRKSDGNKSEAARLLHMSRRRLYSRLDHHGIPY